MTVNCEGFDFSPFNPTQFRLSFTKIPRVPFFCHNVNIPEISFGTAIASSRWHDVPLPGEKLNFGEFSADILLDKDMRTYHELYRWMRNISVLDDGSTDWTSHCSVHTSSSIFHFKGVYPIVIGSLAFSKTTTDSPGLTFSTVFRFTTFDLNTDTNYN